MTKRAEARRRARAKPRESNMTLLLVGGMTALVLLIMVALAVTRPQSTASTNPNQPQTIPNPEIARISPSDANARLGQPGVVFLDTRSAQEFAESHIPNAINMPLPEVPGRFAEIPRDAEVIAYCT